EAPAEEPPAEELPAEEGAEGEGVKSGQSYRKQKRGGYGIRDVRCSERNGPVVDVIAVRETDDVMFVTTGGMVTRTGVGSIRSTGRNTQGVRIMNLLEDDKVSSVARVPAEEVDAPGEAPAELPAGETPPA